MAVAIVGGGASGTILAAQLAKRGIGSFIIEGSGRAGRGVAYSTCEDVHLLNVRAEGMSAWSGRPDHFARHFARDGGEPKGFAERRQFGRYLSEILEEATASGKTKIEDASAIGAKREAARWRLSLDDGSTLYSDALVLATGNQQPEALAPFRHVGDRLIDNPWADRARAAVEKLASSGEAVLVVGTGLTMVDVALSLNASGFSGRMIAMSRRGLVPRAHADFSPAPVAREELPGRLGELLRWLRQRGSEVGWRAAIDSVRPHSHWVWQALTTEEQWRFLRHARPWWDVHRHRIAPQVAASVAGMISEGRLDIIAGRVLNAAEKTQGIMVQYQRRGSASVQSEIFGHVINCTGPLHSIGQSTDPLLRDLLNSEEVTPDQLGIGLDVDPSSRAGHRLWALGPLTKGRFWEITAVPDIREQAAAVAAQIEHELKL